MKKLSLILIALFTCATFYCERDTNRRHEGRRDVEPRLSNDTEWNACRPGNPVYDRVLVESRCQASITLPDPPPCHEIANADDARRALSWPDCMDDAVEILGKLAKNDPEITSDYAAALYVRAHRSDRAEDLLEAYRQATLAVSADASLPAARFNRALILEALGAREEAIAAWNEFLPVAEGGWRREAITRRDRLQQRVAHAESTVSSEVRQFEEVLLLRWAENPTEENFAPLPGFARALSQRLGGDTLPIETVDAIARAKNSPERWNALRAGHRDYALNRTARRESRTLPRSYGEIAASLAKGGSPFSRIARVWNEEPLGAELERDGHLYHAAIAYWLGAVRLQQNQFHKSRAEYEKALAIYKKLRDYEGLTAVHSRLIGLYRQLGDRRKEWRHAVYAQRHVDHLIDSRYRTSHYLEMATAARQWGQADLARFYLNQHVADLRRAGPSHSILLAAALSHHALAAVDSDVAKKNLEEMNSLRLPTDMIPFARMSLEARKAEAGSRISLAEGDPNRAIQLLTDAIGKTERDHRTTLVSLLTRRADAHLLANDEPAAKADLEQAVALLQREGESQLAQRGLWSPDETLRSYFDRFQRTYRQLIRIYMNHEDFADAFEYAERARAAEPLNLIGGHPASLAEILTKLPAQTYVLEYCVLDDETYYWLIGNGRIWARRSVPRATIERWSSDFRNAMQDGRIDDMHVVLQAAHRQLIAPALEIIPPDSRLMIIPDGALYTLPFPAMHSGEKDYLVKTVIPQYSGSAALYLESLERDAKIPPNATPSVLAIGDPAFDEALPAARDMRRLPGAEEEARKVLSQYRQTAVLTDEEATVPALSSRAPQSDVIHIAAHAVVNEYEPARSAILLAKSDEHPGGLEPHEIQRLQLHKTRLMVLSACETGGGLRIGSEGVAPLVRPTLAAGVPGVVATLWSVNDATTSALMVSFHAKYAAGQDAAVALRNAQVEAIDRKASVRDWAAFQVIGHASSPFAPRPPDQGGTSIGIHSSHSVQRSDRLRSQ